MNTDHEHHEFLRDALDHVEAMASVAEDTADEIIVETWDADPDDPEFIACLWNLNMVRDDDKGRVSARLLDAGYSRGSDGKWRKI